MESSAFGVEQEKLSIDLVFWEYTQALYLKGYMVTN